MKTRFNTFDIVCVVSELQKYVGMRVNNIYDIDNKTYLIRLQKTEEKAIILLESGNRIHSTAFEWPKNVAPSGFSMKMRKHLKNKRLECLTQLGTDRIIDLQFGSGEAAYHVILELYDRGNIILTDFELKILYILRPHTEGEKVRFAVKEVYPQNRAREAEALSKEKLLEILQKAKTGDQLKKVLVPNLDYGPAIIEHVLLKEGFSNNVKIGKTFDIEKDIDRVVRALAEAELIFASGTTGGTKGFITQKKEDRGTTDSNEPNFFLSNQEFHPMLFAQHANSPYLEFDTFNQAADEFFSAAESQKIELKGIQQEREAYKRLDKVKHDHSQRLVALEKTQEVDKQKAELISRNQELVDKAIMAVQSALASQLSWADIGDLVKNAAANGDPTAQSITNLKLETNHISISLTDPYAAENNSDSNEENDTIPAMTVDIDLGLTAFANARKYYDQKRFAAKKQQKTIDAQSKAFKSAEKKTKQALKEVQTITNINKARKVYWFEKFFWFISSENYLVIAGRDQQQNELIVKRYLRAKDIYVHADIHGASSVIIKNPSGEPVPPKTLNEAGTMAICYSVAWEAKVVTNAYWVWAEQVSKTAPTGEYLATGSFMVRGKKNFLPPSHLILGMSFLFKLEDGFIENHKGERKVVANLEDIVVEDDPKDEVEVEILDESDEEGHAEVKKDDKIEDTAALETETKSDIKTNLEDEETPKFPDTQVKIQHFGGTKMNILTESTLPNKDPENERIVYLGDNKPVTLNTAPRSRMNSETKNKQTKELAEKPDLKEDTSKQQAKRGQKGKLKKIKEKYKDQDDEERQLRMEILQSSGMGKDLKKSKKAKDNPKSKKTEPKIKREPRPKQTTEESGGVDEDEPTVQAEVDMIDALTGIPSPEDELLFAVPVIAPYNTLANYKFKVKLTPGTGKRGKASKTALAMFLKDRTITPREKDLLKAVKDELLARNLPGKVKLSAPRLMALKK